MNPTSFETSWTEAEKAAFDLLCTATGTQSGTSAHLGRNPGVLNAWHFACAKIAAGGEVFYADDLPALIMPVYAECVFTRRAACQAWAMRIAAGLPADNVADTNIVNFRIRDDGWDEIQYAVVPYANEGKEIPVWRLRIGMDLVFATGGKANSAV